MSRLTTPRTPTRSSLMLLAAIMLLVAATIWRASNAPATEPPSQPTPAVMTRQVSDIKLRMPRSWVQLHHGPDHDTWGTADRSHTVTVARTEAGILPLSAVVQTLTAEATTQLPGLRQVGRARLLELDRAAPHADTAMLVRFRTAETTGAPLDVVQVWRRDSRAGEDLVATWTSNDGRWPAAPGSSIPRSASSR